MNLDDLKRGLATLADDMDAFEGDVRALHRGERRRRGVVSAIAFAVLAVVGVSAVLAIRQHGSGQVRVAGIPSKEVSPSTITHVDVVVVPASPAVQELLDVSPVVSRYARIPRGDRSSDSPDFPQKGVCALQTSDGYAVDFNAGGPDPQRALAASLTGQATVYSLSGAFGVDAEIFLKVGVSADAASAIKAALTSDPDIASVQHLSTADAYAIFKQDFADQPALVASTKQSDLPQSFRIDVEPGRSVSAVTSRYEHMDGVDTVITSNMRSLFDPALAPKGTDKLTSPCATP